MPHKPKQFILKEPNQTSFSLRHQYYSLFANRTLRNHWD